MLWLIQIVRDLTQQRRVSVPSYEIFIAVAASDSPNITSLMVVFYCEIPSLLFGSFATDGAAAPLSVKDILVVF